MTRLKFYSRDGETLVSEVSADSLFVPSVGDLVTVEGLTGSLLVLSRTVAYTSKGVDVILGTDAVVKPSTKL